MRLVIATALLVWTTSPAVSAFLVEVDGGDAMTVDSYWDDGADLHLYRGGMDLRVARERVRVLGDAPEEMPTAPSATARPSRTPAAAPSRETLLARERQVSRRVLRLQQERFEAAARAEPPATVERLSRAFRRAQVRRQAINAALAGADPTP